MPLSFRVPGSSLLRRRTSSKGNGSGVPQEQGDAEEVVSESDGATASFPGASSSSGRPKSRFRITVPEGAKPGQRLKVQGPDGRHVHVTLPAGCEPGRQLWVQPDGPDKATIAGVCANNSEAMQELEDSVRATADAARASRASLRQRLEDELEVQRALWSSAGQAPTAASFLQQFIGGALGGLTGGGSLGCAGATYEDGLSQTQALVFAAADAGDCKQLLAALSEARKFSVVSRSLEEAAQNLGSAEEAIVTWQCLLDALRVRDCHEMEVWLEQARGLGLRIPSEVHGVLAQLRRRKDLEQRLQFALEACDPELLAEVVGEAERGGIGDTALAREAAVRMVALASGRCARTASSAAPRGTSGRPRPPMSQWEAALNGLFGAQAPSQASSVPSSQPKEQSSRARPAPREVASSGREEVMAWIVRPGFPGLGLGGIGCRRPSASPAPSPRPTTSPRASPRITVEEPEEPDEGRGASSAPFASPAAPQSMGPQDPSPDSPFGVKAGAGGSKAYQFWQDANAWREGQQPQKSSPRPAEPEQPHRGPVPEEPAMEKLDSRSARQLLEECRRLGLDTRGCAERDDLIRLLRERQQPIASEGTRGRTGMNGPTGGLSGGARSSSAPRPAEKPMEPEAGTVWERRTPPTRFLSKRSQALFLLGLDANPGKRANLPELRTAYRRAAMESHPDKIQNHARQEEAKELFQKVKEAFDYLSSAEGGHLK